MSDAPRDPDAIVGCAVLHKDTGGRTIPLVILHADGSIEYGPGYDPGDAARQFWNDLARHMPTQQPDTELVSLREDNTRLRGLLSEVLGHFTHQTHPGAPCLQTGHVNVATVERWREALR